MGEPTIAVPAELTGPLTEALMSALSRTATRITNARLDPEDYPQPLSDFDSYRAALDAIGWGRAPGDIDVTTHRPALTAALRVQLAFEVAHARSGEAAATSNVEAIRLFLNALEANDGY